MFVKDKKLISLYTNSLYKLQKLLETAMESIPSDDTDVDATISTYQKKKNILNDFERNVKNKSKNEIINYYDDLGKEIEMHYDKQVNAFVSSSITPNINDLNKQISALRDIQNIANETYNKLLALNNKTLEIINEFHSLEN